MQPLTPAQGGLGVPDVRFEAPQQFAASTLITSPHLDSITTQSIFMVAGENSMEELKGQHQALKTASVKSRMESNDSTLPSDRKDYKPGWTSCLSLQGMDIIIMIIIIIILTIIIILREKCCFERTLPQTGFTKNRIQSVILRSMTTTLETAVGF